MRLVNKVVRQLCNVSVNTARCVARPIMRALNLDVARIAGSKARVRVDPFTEFGSELLKLGERPTEAFTVPLMKKTLRLGDTYCDIGAHWGIYTVVAAELVGRSGHVIAVEPTPQNCARLVENITLNRAKNVTVEQVAIGELNAKGLLRFGGDSGNLSALQTANSQGPDADTHSCEVTTLAAVLDRNKISRVRLMKMDIEGGECRAARDVCDYTDRFDCIYIELHPPFEDPVQDSAFLYRMLGKNRLLFMPDCAARKLVPVRSHVEFDAKIGLYYFISARMDGEFQSLLENFRW